MQPATANLPDFLLPLPLLGAAVEKEGEENCVDMYQ